MIDAALERFEAMHGNKTESCKTCAANSGCAAAQLRSYIGPVYASAHTGYTVFSIVPAQVSQYVWHWEPIYIYTGHVWEGQSSRKRDILNFNENQIVCI